MNYMRVVLMAAVGYGLSGCGLVFQGTQQEISLMTNPACAVVQMVKH